MRTLVARISVLGLAALASACVADERTATAEQNPQPTTSAEAASPVTDGSLATSTSPNASTTSAPAPRLAVDIARDDVLASIIPEEEALDVSAALQCDGAQYRPGEAIPFAIDSEAASASFGTTEFDGRPAFRLRTNENDATFAGGRRCEFAFLDREQRLPRETIVWNTFVVRTNDWSGTEDQQIIAQWHDGDTTESKTPILAFYVIGDRLRIVSRTDASATPSNETSIATTLHENEWPAAEWVRVVVKSLISSNAQANPFVRVWIEGRLVVDHQGPLGYNVEELDYAKVGFYHWTGSNPWDSSVPTRDVAVAEFSIVVDSHGRYVFDDIARFQEQRLSAALEQ